MLSNAFAFRGRNLDQRRHEVADRAALKQSFRDPLDRTPLPADVQFRQRQR
jgi:hypothetical protein